ncbi:MAG: M16 family metallopeptidase [Candidatus Acidiferrales bacterium]
MKESENNIELLTLPNGLTIITEPMHHVRSVSVGIWIRSGSRREPARLNGISHFIEHMVFKGTERRSTEQIARETDRIGGMLDAFTSREMVCFNTRVLAEHLTQAFDLLADIVRRPLFSTQEIVREKSVILEEIKMTEDNPEDLVHELLTRNFWCRHSLGRPILGTPQTVKPFSRSVLRNWFSHCYAPNNMIVAAAGSVTHGQMVELVGKEFSTAVPLSQPGPVRPPRPDFPVTLRKKRELEQVHICLAVPAYSASHPRRFAASLLNTILGTGMSSRLFQNIREKQGLAYSVFSEANPCADVGMLSVYAGTTRVSALQLVRSVIAEFRSLKTQPVSEQELRLAKDHLKGSILLSLDSTGSRMSTLARQYFYFGRFFTPEEIIAYLQAVTPEEIQQVACDFFQTGRITAAVLGNLRSFKLPPEILAC